MSYNLLVEGSVDYEALALAAARHQSLELFPIPARTAEERDALGVALPFRNVDQGIAEMESFVREALVKGLTIADLYQGTRISSENDLQGLVERLKAE
ncbi:MAG TPA: hypothetical protein VGK67_17660 [Myxococcales bacterium]|jgi:hypothetical protein